MSPVAFAQVTVQDRLALHVLQAELAQVQLLKPVGEQQKEFVQINYLLLLRKMQRFILSVNVPGVFLRIRRRIPRHDLVSSDLNRRWAPFLGQRGHVVEVHRLRGLYKTMNTKYFLNNTHLKYHNTSSLHR
jgi:hypothetical protein